MCTLYLPCPPHRMLIFFSSPFFLLEWSRARKEKRKKKYNEKTNVIEKENVFTIYLDTVGGVWLLGIG